MDIDELCNEYIEHNRDMVPQGVELVYEPSENNMTLYSDRRRIGQVLQNLLSNACKNTTSGRITINTSRGEDCIQFVVTDTGTGIPQGKADVIFEHFEKLDHYSPGLGLGLYVGRLIVRALGGDIQLDMLYTDGARFVFTVPNHIEQEDDEDIMQEQLQEITA
jgi:signal transduction histidine kinase